MPLTSAPKPESGVQPFLVTFEPFKQMPSLLAETIQYWTSRVETEILEPALHARDLHAVFPQLMKNYGVLSQAISSTLAAAFTLDEAFSLAIKGIDEAKKAFKPAETLEGDASRSTEAGLDMVQRIFVDQLGVWKEKPAVTAQEATLLSGLWVALSAYNLCLQATLLYLRKPLAVWKTNAETLSRWSFSYATWASMEWGQAELAMGFGYPLDEVARRVV